MMFHFSLRFFHKNREERSEFFDPYLSDLFHTQTHQSARRKGRCILPNQDFWELLYVLVLLFDPLEREAGGL